MVSRYQATCIAAAEDIQPLAAAAATAALQLQTQLSVPAAATTKMTTTTTTSTTANEADNDRNDSSIDSTGDEGCCNPTQPGIEADIATSKDTTLK